MTETEIAERVKAKLGHRSLVLVGLMGCGKSSVGRRLAARLQMPFVDADDEIEKAAAKSISEIFADYGEQHFRDGERRVIARLLGSGPQVLATGGGAFMNEETRDGIRAAGVSVWLRAELPVLMRRVHKREQRPLLQSGNAEATMSKLIADRYPVYALADITVESREEPHDAIVNDIIEQVLAMPEESLGASSRKANQPVRVPVSLGARSYEVEIGPGLMITAGQAIVSHFGKVKCGIVTDSNVARHHLANLEASLVAAGLTVNSIVLNPGEATKSFNELAPLCERLLQMDLERGDLVIPFGGGVIGDLAGFAAGILRRGIRFVQMPTSLLAQVDSSVGGKTGINTAQGKNLIGVFHQPSLVLADTDLLRTLDEREMRAGYAEVAKYGLLGDRPFFEWLEENWRGVFAFEPLALTHAIETSVAAKATIVARDELETGDRALLNLGHTFGHALEAWSGYSSRLLHGEGVSIGMCMAYRLSEELGLIPLGTADRVTRHLADVGLPVRVSQIPGGPPDPAAIISLMGQDKKVRNGRLTFILVRGIGEAYVSQDVSESALVSFLMREVRR